MFRFGIFHGGCYCTAAELILETPVFVVVVVGDEGYSVLPTGRYAKMLNIWFLPSCATLVTWMERAGFRTIRIIDVSKTTVTEQRTTDWMRFQSLSDFLDPSNV